jgi:galactose mutarotase-like enzyme
VEFTHVLTDPSSGYAYLYKKTVRLAKNEPRLIIEHSLKNTGKKTIETNVYNHGFFVIDGQPSGPDFTVKFPFDVKAAADLQGLAEVQGRELHYLKELQPGGQSVFTQLTGYGDSPSDFDFRVENRKTGAGVHVAGDRPLWKINFWSIRTTVCPEDFINMKIEPGKESQWRITYDFYVLPPAGKEHP